jgi:hypothetical protein
LCFKLIKIDKNADNSAYFTFQAIGNKLPFAFTLETFKAGETLNLTIKKNSINNFKIEYSTTDVIENTVKILVNFN